MRQRGVALITAIVLVAIATVLAVHVGTQAALDLRRTAGLVSLDQGWHVALGAEAWAAEVLREDDETDDDVDHPGEAWARPLPALPVDGGELRGSLEDMQGRFNLNTLVTESGEPNGPAIELFQRLLVAAGANPRWANLTADWIDPDTQPEFDGAEDGTYLSQNPPYRAANNYVTTTTELMALPGMTAEEFARIRPYVSALPIAAHEINLCTAKAPLLQALADGAMDFGDAELLTSNRRDGCYPTTAMLEPLVDEELRQNISESSNWFRAVTAVRIGTSEITLYSLIERNGAGGVRTYLRSTGTE
jgi:general secretion pathway protein K